MCLRDVVKEMVEYELALVLLFPVRYLFEQPRGLCDLSSTTSDNKFVVM